MDPRDEYVRSVKGAYRSYRVIPLPDGGYAIADGYDWSTNGANAYIYAYLQHTSEVGDWLIQNAVTDPRLLPSPLRLILPPKKENFDGLPDLGI